MTTMVESNSHAKKEEFLEKLDDKKLLGEVISWKANGPYPYSVVKQALVDSNLDPKVAKERLPSQAFSRAARELSHGRVIDIVRNEGEKDLLVFQFTQKFLIDSLEDGEKKKQWKYDLETKLTLHKDTGKVECKITELQELAQRELDKHIVQRTAGDINGIVQTLFHSHADLIPFRDQGGVYIVPIEFQDFILKIEGLLGKLGGKINRLPIPSGTSYGDATFQECMKSYLSDLIEGHKKAVQDLSDKTRVSTIEAVSEKINATRLKVESYAHYLKEKSENLLLEVKEARLELAKKIVEIVKTQKGG